MLLVGAVALALVLHVRPKAIRVQAEPILLGMVIAFLAVICCLSNGMFEERVRYWLPGGLARH